MNGNEPPFAQYAEDFEYVVLIGFEKQPDWEAIEAFGGVVLREEQHFVGGVVGRRSWWKRPLYRSRLVRRILGLHRPRPI